MNIETRRRAYAWFVVLLLMLAYVLSFVDRQILNLLVGPIRSDLGISDTQMSLLMGLSFAVFYTLCGIPLARWADHGNRSRLIIGGVLVWSLATALCGFAQRYVHLLLARIGVGVGEAALSPAAYSLICDYFPREQRATAISVYSMGIYIGSGMAFLIGGLVIKLAGSGAPVTIPLLGEMRPWQSVFVVLGIAGVVFSALLLLLREPARQQATHVPMSVRDSASALWQQRRLLLGHNFGFAFAALAAYACAAWIPSFFIRVHGWTAPQVGVTYGIIMTVFGTLGVLSGGRLADRWLRMGITDATLRVALGATLLAIPVVAFTLQVSSARVATWLLCPAVFLLSVPFGVGPAALQEVVPSMLRGQASALSLLVVNLVGLGIGPTAVALLTDYVYGNDLAVGQSLLWVSVVALLVSGALLAWTRPAYRARIEATLDPRFAGV